MTTVHVHHQFHAVGHGTFFTGVACAEDQDPYRWVYDCGSKRRKRIGEAIETLEAWDHWPPGVTVDLMVVSHFDDDHVNGLEDFLARYRVKWLVLPYIGFKQRLAHAASLGAGDVSAAATSGFAIDPLGYLSARGLADRVDGVLLVEGGGGGDGVPDAGVPLPDPPRLDDANGIRNRPDDLVARAYRVDLHTAAATPRPRLHLRSHSEAVAAGAVPLEFVFYNTALPDGRANRSKQPIHAVAKEVAEILARYDVLDPLRRPRRGWRDQLKACYTRHFGYSGLERNNISLCVLARPLATVGMGHCAWFDEPPTGGEPVQIPVADDPQALLMTGDLTLNGEVITAMRSHFREWRWQQLGVAQVPHHGSRHSWASGNARMFPAPAFVQCVPTLSGKAPHPHPLVIADLSGSQVHCANYDQSIVQTYHFKV